MECTCIANNSTCVTLSSFFGGGVKFGVHFTDYQKKHSQNVIITSEQKELEVIPMQIPLRFLTQHKTHSVNGLYTLGPCDI